MTARGRTLATGRAAGLALAVAVQTTAAPAQDAAAAPPLAIELNAAQEDQGACTLTFLVTNGFAVAIDNLVYEAVLFDTGGQVVRLTLFDFGALPAGRPRVRQFSVPGTTCTGLGRILFNGVHACRAEGLDKAACEAGLAPSTRTGIEVLG